MLAVIELRRLGDAPAALATIEAIDRARLDPDKGALVDALRAEANAAVAAGPARSGGAG
jgi:hypothetical protein